MLGGYLIAYLNLDEVIRIIREEDDPKAVMMKRFKLTEPQVEAILNMRLRQLRKLDEIEIRQEFDSLKAEKKDLEALLKSEERQWKCVAFEIQEVKKTFGPDTPLGKRRTGFADAPEIDLEEMQEAMIEREPVTVVLSKKGWIRAMRGHLDRHQRAHLQGGRPADARLPRDDDGQGADRCRPAARCSRSRRRSFPAGAAMASRCVSCSTWTRTRTSSRSSRSIRTASASSRAPPATASVSPRASSSRIRGRASRC